MAKQSAGILVYRRKNNVIEVLLVHPGGPFFAKKDDGVWSVPKGEFLEGEDAQQAASREFKEETGTSVPAGKQAEIGSVKLSGGKTVYAWAVEGDLDSSKIKSNNFSLEWPPRSGKQQEFPEIDRAGWFTLAQAARELNKNQVPFLERLAVLLNAAFDSDYADTVEPPSSPKQVSLF